MRFNMGKGQEMGKKYRDFREPGYERMRKNILIGLLHRVGNNSSTEEEVIRVANEIVKIFISQLRYPREVVVNCMRTVGRGRRSEQSIWMKVERMVADKKI